MQPVKRAGAALIAAVLLQGCNASQSCCGPREFLSLFVGVQVDSAVFRSQGRFVIQLVPTDQTGRSLVREAWAVSAALTLPAAGAVRVSDQMVQPADTVPVAAALDLDDSQSMAGNDPQLVRASGAQLFWQAVLGARPGNQVGLLDFGGALSSPGFRATRLLQGYTLDRTALDAQLLSIQAQSGGGTPLYHSALEVVRWSDTALTVGPRRRLLVIITDGFPQDSARYRDSLFAAAAARAIRILAVGVGPASDRGTKTDPRAVAVVQALATRTGGVYAGVTTAAQLDPVLHALATASTSEQLVATLRLVAVPPRGTPVGGSVTVSGMRGKATAHWLFVAP